MVNNNCNEEDLVKTAEIALEILNSNKELTDENYKKFEDDRNENINKIKECHDKKMKELGDADTHSGNSIHLFEKKIAERLQKENETTDNYNTKLADNIKEEKEKENTNLLNTNYKLIKQIEEYKVKTDKINADIGNNNTTVKELTNKTNLLKNINIGVFIFVIISLIFINFKPFFRKKAKMLSPNKENKLFNLKDDKKQYENIDNIEKMKYQKQLLSK